MRNIVSFALIAGLFLMVSCGQSASDKAAADQAKIDSIAQAEVQAAKQAVLDSIAQVEEELKLQAKMDSLEAAVEDAKQEVKQAGAAAAAATQKPQETVKEEPTQAKPSRGGASKRNDSE